MPNDLSVNAQVSSSLMKHDKSGLSAALTTSASAIQKKELTSVKNMASDVPGSTESVDKSTDPADVMSKIHEQVQNLQELSSMNSWSVNFSIDEESGHTVIQVKDAETQEVIRQMPSDEWLAMSKKIQDSIDSGNSDSLSGLLFDNQV